MSVVLTPELEARIARLGAECDGKSAATVLVEALDLYEELRDALTDGARSGPSAPLDIEEIIAEAKRRQAGSPRAAAEGDYASAADFLTDALSLLERHADLRAAIREGVESGPAMDGRHALNELRERLHAYRAK